MNIEKYLEENKEFYDNDTKIAYFKIGYILRKLFNKMKPADISNFVKRELKGLDWRYLTKKRIVHKLVPKLTYENEEYNLGCDDLLTDISEIIIKTLGLEDLTGDIGTDPVIYISMGMNMTQTLDDFLSLKEASELFGKAESTLKGNIKNGKFKENVDVKKIGNQWVFLYDPLVREYGKPSNK